MKVVRERLLSALEAAGVVVSPKPGIAQSDCLVFSDGEVRAFNGELFCRIPSPLGKEIVGAVRAKSLLEMLRRLPDKSLVVDIRNNRLCFKGKQARRCKFRCEAVVDEVFDLVKSPETWFPVPDGFDEAVRMCVGCTNKDGENNTTCLHITPEVVEAFGSLQICRWSLRMPISAPILVQASGIKHVATFGMTEMGESDKFIHFRNPDRLELAIRKEPDATYEDLSEFFGKIKGANIRFPSGLDAAVGRASVISSENGDSNNLVRVVISPTTKKVRVGAESVSCEVSEERDLDSYEGSEKEFYINPDTFVAILRRDHECRVGSDVLKIRGDKYVYCAVLVRPDELNPSEEIEDVPEDEEVNHEE